MHSILYYNITYTINILRKFSSVWRLCVCLVGENIACCLLPAVTVQSSLTYAIFWYWKHHKRYHKNKCMIILSVIFPIKKNRWIFERFGNGEAESDKRKNDNKKIRYTHRLGCRPWSIKALWSIFVWTKFQNYFLSRQENSIISDKLTVSTTMTASTCAACHY